MTTETLTCSSCGASWTRERKRGRKPSVCPDCALVPAEPREAAPKAELSADVLDLTALYADDPEYAGVSRHVLAAFVNAGQEPPTTDQQNSGWTSAQLRTIQAHYKVFDPHNARTNSEDED